MLQLFALDPGAITPPGTYQDLHDGEGGGLSDESH